MAGVAGEAPEVDPPVKGTPRYVVTTRRSENPAPPGLVTSRAGAFEGPIPWPAAVAGGRTHFRDDPVWSEQAPGLPPRRLPRLAMPPKLWPSVGNFA